MLSLDSLLSQMQTFHKLTPDFSGNKFYTLLHCLYGSSRLYFPFRRPGKTVYESFRRCMHRASSYNMYIKQQNAQISCD